ncbi:MAG TPA: NAD-dependent malic enzyme [Gemmatimonadota bacterium]|nr:NAD-dependent malic enzyme [Gemmatimonadota bacterium]
MLDSASFRGRQVLNDPHLNRGTAFTAEERERLGLTGLLPPGGQSLADQVARVRENCRRKPTDLERYIFLMSLLDRNETLFYRAVLDNLPDYLPIIYTPTVGQAAREYGHIFRRPRGLYVTAEDRGRISQLLENWGESDVRVIVATDGSRILGLGDLGANGMSISIGKLALYTVAGGIDPRRTLPVMLDIGTDNEALLADPLYLGLRRRRLVGDEYLAFVDEFMEEVTSAFPDALIQFEDFVTPRAYALLARYRDTYRMFNDDIQGTAAVVLAGLMAAMRITGETLGERPILFVGAGSANTGVANLLVRSLARAGLSTDEARRRCWFFDDHGLLTARRESPAPHCVPYAHEAELAEELGLRIGEGSSASELVATIRALRPAALVGATGAPGIFTRDALAAMADVNERPIVFALSNPTDRSEVNAEDAYAWTGGRAVFASGSPFGPVTVNGRTFEPGQANNVYVFPGIGLAVTAFGIDRISEDMFLAAAGAVAGIVSEDRLTRGGVFPALGRIREVSAGIAAAVGRVAYATGAAMEAEPADLLAFVRERMYTPEYGAGA